MKLRTFYELAVKKGMKADMRKDNQVKATLSGARSEYKKAKGVDRRYFDKAALSNPYYDTRILSGTGEEEVCTVMAGIDIDVGEILLADRLREKGVKIDLVVSHHPAGRAYAELNRVMEIQPSLWERYGFDPEVASKLMKKRSEEVSRGISAANHQRAVDAARILGIPFMCIHTAADNCVASYLQGIFDKKKPGTLKNALGILKAIPEYKDAVKNGAGPHILIGKETDKAGRIFVDMTGGTSGPDKMFSRLSQAGVRTIVGMHCKESAYKEASSEMVNYIIAGHISSDNLGLNLLFDEVEKSGKLDFVACSGFRRFKR
ncbi:MAG: NGG1p interacting factor NIF3 [Candidatus Omnitrophica bacterium]|nr:NGG1p interacting factor NIF3 [Candidatus Omnitrophota bacterium]MDD5487954.1 NGG1p interacting factor NIF3 [Candidatus Omnitrophota bacterium]